MPKKQPDEGFADSVGKGRFIDIKDFNRKMADAINGKGIQESAVVNGTYASGPAFEHEKDVSRILSGNGNPVKDKALITTIAGYLGIELSYTHSLPEKKQKSPFEKAPKGAKKSGGWSIAGDDAAD